MFSRFDTIPECDRETDRQTHYDGIAGIASRGKNADLHLRRNYIIITSCD